MEFILNKRMAIFEQVLKLQVIHLRVSSAFTPEKHLPFLKHDVDLIGARIGMFKAMKQVRFPLGGFIDNPGLKPQGVDVSTGESLGSSTSERLKAKFIIGGKWKDGGDGN